MQAAGFGWGRASNYRSDPELLRGVTVDDYRPLVRDIDNYPTKHDNTPLDDNGNLADAA